LGSGHSVGLSNRNRSSASQTLIPGTMILPNRTA
jgi:hypothetical protein